MHVYRMGSSSIVYLIFVHQSQSQSHGDLENKTSELLCSSTGQSSSTSIVFNRSHWAGVETKLMLATVALWPKLPPRQQNQEASFHYSLATCAHLFNKTENKNNTSQRFLSSLILAILSSASKPLNTLFNKYRRW